MYTARRSGFSGYSVRRAATTRAWSTHCRGRDRCKCDERRRGIRFGEQCGRRLAGRALKFSPSLEFPSSFDPPHPVLDPGRHPQPLHPRDADIQERELNSPARAVHSPGCKLPATVSICDAISLYAAFRVGLVCAQRLDGALQYADGSLECGRFPQSRAHPQSQYDCWR